MAKTAKKVEQVVEVKAIPFADTIEHEVEAVVLAKLAPAIHDAIHVGVQQALAKATQPPQAKEVAREEQHGVRRPKAGGRCDQVWQQLGNMNAKGEELSLQAIVEVARKNGWNENNARVELYQWRKFHGMMGRRVVNHSATKERRTMPGRRIASGKLPRGVRVDRRVAQQDRRLSA